MPDNFIVAIGYSAGGLQSLTSYFDATPHDGATYVILTHLPAGYKSQLQQILQQHSKLTIKEAVNNIAIETDTVYTVPSGMYITIKDGHLMLRPRAIFESHMNKTVDIFLQSLAKDKGRLSIAIILSGAGSDGADGVELIKKAGGMVMVQTPASCQFGSMPQHALNTGYVDHNLLPADMPPVVLQHVSTILKTTDLVNALKQRGKAD